MIEFTEQTTRIVRWLISMIKMSSDLKQPGTFDASDPGPGVASVTITAEDRRIVARCSREDLAGGAEDDDPTSAASGWLRAAERASQHVGTDPLTRIAERVGLSGIARIYEETRDEARAASRELGSAAAEILAKRTRASTSTD